MTSKTLHTVAAVTSLCVAAATAQADVWHFKGTLDGGQVTPPTTSESTGTLEIRYDDDTNVIEVDVYVEGIGLDNDLTAAHIHIGRYGFAGPWNIQLGPPEEWFQDGNGIRRLVNADYPEADEHYLLTDGTFIMLHTNEWPGGEIRGQVIASPRLEFTSIARNRPAIFQTTNADPGEKVFFVYSIDGVGTGAPIDFFGGMTLDLNDPPRLLGKATADDAGSAVLVVTPGPETPLIEVSLQAAIRRGAGGADSVKSNTVSTVVLP